MVSSTSLLAAKPGGEFRVHHFVANERRDLITLGLQHRLVRRPAGEVGHRQVEERDQPAQHILQRHVFAKRHQLLFQVGAIASPTAVMPLK
jgi:hypothetical protein